MRLLICGLLFLMAAAAADSPNAAWIRDIELRGNPVYVARLNLDPTQAAFSLPRSTAGYEHLTRYLRQEDFIRQFLSAFALTVSERDGDHYRHLVFVNEARTSKFPGDSEAFLGHELGHAWLKALGYPSPIYVEGPKACLSIHTGDIVQHILIRREMRQRGIDPLPSTLRVLEAALAGWSTAELPLVLSPCDAARTAAIWTDVQLSITSADWPNRDRFNAHLRQRYPKMDFAVSSLVKYLNEANVADRDIHREALRFVHRTLIPLLSESP